VAPLLRSAGRPVRSKDDPYKEYLVSSLRNSRSRDSFMSLTFDDMKDFLWKNGILWLSTHCFILSSSMEIFRELLAEGTFLPLWFAKNFYDLTIFRRRDDCCDFRLYCTADTSRGNIFNEISQVVDALLDWIGRLDFGRKIGVSRLLIEGIRDPTTRSLPNISFAAKVLRPLKKVFFNDLVLDEKACHAIRDADFDAVTYGSFVSIPNVAALQLDVKGPAKLGFLLYQAQNLILIILCPHHMLRCWPR
jgi:hypothetical protein